MADTFGGNDPLLTCLAILTRLHGRPHSADALKAGLPLVDAKLTPALFVRAAARAGLAAGLSNRPLPGISPLLLPAVLLLNDGGACIVTSRDGDDLEVIFPESGGQRRVGLADLEAAYSGVAIFAQPTFRLDQRADEHKLILPPSWLWGTLLRFRREYADVVLASLFINLFAIATSLFAMNVYDRVVPNRALETLWVLALGVCIVFFFEFLLRTLRGYLLDLAGKKADVLLSSGLFQQVMGLRMEARPASAGAMANNLREFESLRDFFTSATLATLVDLPFLFLFIIIIALIGGWLALIPLVAAPLVVVVGLLLQPSLARAIQENLAEATQKHGVLVEAIAGLEAIKAASAEGQMQAKWERLVGLGAQSGLKSRLISSLAVNFTLAVQQIVSVAMVVAGVYLIADGTLTLGALIACNILAGRALAPLGQVSGLLMRYQGARMAFQGLDKLMKMEQERPAERDFLHRPQLVGEIVFDRTDFAYPRQQNPALSGVNFRVGAGERVAILGKAGSGKSTLLKLVAGLYRPLAGSIRLDGADIAQIDPVDLRRNVGYLAQDARLFFGTLRENIALGMAGAEDAAILAAARLAGVESFAGAHPAGFDLPIGEGGEGLSGGQRQAVAVARTLLPEPTILLLDEPTAAMDHNAEQAFVEKMQTFLAGRTLLLVTHKPSLLALVERIIVVDGGRVVADGPKEQILRALAQG